MDKIIVVSVSASGAPVERRNFNASKSCMGTLIILGLVLIVICHDGEFKMCLLGSQLSEKSSYFLIIFYLFFSVTPEAHIKPELNHCYQLFKRSLHQSSLD
jgi:hypothetical protein